VIMRLTDGGYIYIFFAFWSNFQFWAYFALFCAFFTSKYVLFN
jgi:hypothetical protein